MTIRRITVAESLIFFRNFNYDLCLARDAVWTVAEAIDYLATYLTSKESWYVSQDAQKAYPYIRYQIFGALKQSIEAGTLLINEKYKENGCGEDDHSLHDLDFEKSTVEPLILICWAINNNIDVPKQFANYVSEKQRYKSDYYESVGIKRTTIHHERCRAIAALLWSANPDITIADMARSGEIRKFGCEEREYETRTVCRWLASLKVVRKVGRCKKKVIPTGLSSYRVDHMSNF